MIPHFRELFSLIQTPRNTILRPDSETIAESRLKKLRDLCDAYQVKSIMLAPPVPSSAHTVHILVRISHGIGVAAWAPVDPTALTARHYEPDAFHLNSEGAAPFTTAIARISGQFYRSEM